MVDYQRYLININFVGRMDISSIRAEGFGKGYRGRIYKGVPKVYL